MVWIRSKVTRGFLIYKIIFFLSLYSFRFDDNGDNLNDRSDRWDIPYREKKNAYFIQGSINFVYVLGCIINMNRWNLPKMIYFFSLLNYSNVWLTTIVLRHYIKYRRRWNRTFIITIIYFSTVVLLCFFGGCCNRMTQRGIIFFSIRPSFFSTTSL